MAPAIRLSSLATAPSTPNSSAALELGVEGAVARLEGLIAGAIAAIPPCRGAGDLEALVKQEAKRLLPASLARHAA
jgi:geranylgeranyl diphosphate synthase type II